MGLFRRRDGHAEPAIRAGLAGREEMARRILTGAPTAGSWLVERLRPAVRYAVRRQPDAGMDVGHSKFGGAPDLPQGTRWPTWTAKDGERRPLQFFAQVDLAAAAAAAPEPTGLPEGGLLSFFVDLCGGAGGVTASDGWETERCHVHYSPARSHLVRCSPRLRPLPSADLLPIGCWTWPSPVHFPPAESPALGELLHDQDAALREAVPDLWFLHGRHQLGGHFAGAGEVVQGWTVVFQLDADPTLDVTWGRGEALLWAVPGSGASEAGTAGMFRLQA